MATNKWVCENCKHVTEQESESGDCPKCGSGDVFPHRRFRCKGCKIEADQPKFFGELDQEGSEYVESDPDPVEEDWKRKCANNSPSNRNKLCGSTKWEQIE